MCYVGKATKIFIFIITVLVVTGLIVGIGVLRRTIHPKSHKCSGDSCYQSDFFPPPPLPEFPISSNPSDPTSNPSPFPPPPPPPESSGSSSNLSPPPPAAAAAAAASPPPSGSSSDRTPPPPPPAVVVSTGSPPPPAPPVVVAAPPPALNPPSPVPVTPGPANSS
ncbi:hypothetical protein OSB04_014233 [Centaurea solstitialis]|uniref:Uncharacterized protein n=1 Tax=Centaurea solstitialis TaxID=347529 RepID=A0AA38T4H0_9ASTR|nr:hypothetical protein OSB04_014233 [Centaurea solstitialis]